MIVNCDYCGKEFDKDKKYIKKDRKNYCCKECQNKGQIKTIICNCAYCGKEVLRLPSEIKRSKTGNVFCDKSCAASFNNKITKTKEVLVEYQKTAFRNYLPVCTNCRFDIREALEVHHIDENRSNNELNNLIILCANCHCQVHYGKLIIDEEIKKKRKMI